MIDEDLDALLADHGVACSCNGVPFVGIKDSEDENIGSGAASAQSNAIALLVKTSDVQSLGIKAGVTIVVATINYLARNPARVDDGAFSTIPLTKGRP